MGPDPDPCDVVSTARVREHSTVRGPIMSSTTAHPSASWTSRHVVVSPGARAGLALVAFVLAITFGAQVAVPLGFTPVPVTLQTLFVILGGVVLGPRLGALAAASYVMIGAAGAPVFSNGAAGLPWLMGPTGGYLLAAPAAAFLAGAVSGGNGRLRRSGSWRGWRSGRRPITWAGLRSSTR